MNWLTYLVEAYHFKAEGLETNAFALRCRSNLIAAIGSALVKSRLAS